MTFPLGKTSALYPRRPRRNVNPRPLFASDQPHATDAPLATEVFSEVKLHSGWTRRITLYRRRRPPYVRVRIRKDDLVCQFRIYVHEAEPVAKAVDYVRAHDAHSYDHEIDSIPLLAYKTLVVFARRYHGLPGIAFLVRAPSGEPIGKIKSLVGSEFDAFARAIRALLETQQEKEETYV